MGRKEKPIQIIEDTSNANIRIICPHPQCKHEFFKKGAWLEKNRTFSCPTCKEPISFKEEELGRLFDDHIKNMRNFVTRMRGHA